MDIPLISIGITYYKASDTIEKAVSSALTQTWKNKEIIIVDDFSNDEQDGVLEKLEQQHSCIRVIRHTVNKGVAAARNEIINQSKGEFLAFFDDDDESMPERLEKQYERIVSYEKEYAEERPVICYTARLQKYPNRQERCEQTMGTNEGIVPNGIEVALRILTGKPRPNIFGSTATCSQMARLTTFKALDGFDEDFRRSEDTEFNVRAAIKGAHFPGLGETLVTQTMTLANDKKLTDEKRFALQLLAKHKDFINKHTDYSFCYQWVEGKYYFLQKKHLSFTLKIIKLFLMHPILTLERFVWAGPNIGFNLRFIRFHHDKK